MSEFLVEIPNPGLIDTHPCNAQAAARSMNTVKTIIKKVTKIINRGLLASAVLDHQPTLDCTACQAEDTLGIVSIDPSTFELWGTDDPDDPVTPPTKVLNYFSMALKHGANVLLAYNPNEGNPDRKWRIIETDHVCRHFVTGIRKEGSSVVYDTLDVSGPACEMPGGGTVFTTTTASALRLIEQDGCVINTYPVLLEVFDAENGTDPTPAIEFTESVEVMTDVFQAGDGDIWGSFLTIIVPCIGSAGSALLIPVADCE